jgi:hypothetical protein
MLKRLESGRAFHEVRVQVRGPWCGPLLSMEAGLHRWVGFSKKTIHMGCQILPTVNRPAAGFWSSDTAKKIPATREWRAAKGDLVMGKTVLMELTPEEYWDRFEEVALEHWMTLSGGRR